MRTIPFNQRTAFATIDDVEVMTDEHIEQSLINLGTTYRKERTIQIEAEIRALEDELDKLYASEV